MYDAYCRIFKRCGLKYAPVEAESGPIGGSASHEFMVPCNAGEDIIVHTEDFSYAANIEKAEVDAVVAQHLVAQPFQAVPGHEQRTPPDAQPGMAVPPTIPPMEEVHTPDVGSIEAVCNFLGTKPTDMIKTLIFVGTDTYAPDKYAATVRRYVASLASIKDLMVSTIARIPALADQLGQVRGISLAYASSVSPFQNLYDVMICYKKLMAVLHQIPDNPINAVEGFSAAQRFEAAGRCKQELVEVHTAVFQNVFMVLVRGDHEVNPAKLSHQAGGKALELAPETIIRWATDANVGFAGPMDMAGVIGKMFIDHAVAAMPVGVTGANKSDYHMKNVVPGRDFPLTGNNIIVADIRNAAPGDTYKGKALVFSHGIEIGHVFKLGTKYSEKLEARFLDEKGVKNACIMGCYGIGINRIFASAIETDAGHDANGPILPVSIAPFEVSIVSLNADKPEVVSTAQSLYKQLQDAGVEVLLDDRDARPGVKFKDADLIGVPLRVVVGEKNLKDGNVEIKRRTDEKATLVPAAEAFAQTTAILKEMKTILE
jgi:prolyl-tRNA synthetase